MKRFIKISIFFVILLIISNIAFATTSGLEEFIDLTVDPDIATDAPLLTELPVDSENVVIKNDKVVIKDDIYVSGDNIVVEEDVDGSVHISATTVNITSNNINGNVFIVAEEININSNIKGSAFLISNTINLSGNVFDLYTISTNLNLNSDFSCNSIKTISENVEIEGKVAQDVYAISGNVNVAENSDALVSGEISCIGHVVGDTTKAENIETFMPDFRIDEEIIGAVAKTFNVVYFVLIISTGFFIIVGIVICTPRKRIDNVYISQNFFKYMVDGLGYYILAIFVSILLMLTIVGIPFSLLLLFVITLLMGKVTLPLATIEIAKLILKNQERKSKAVVAILAFLVFVAIRYFKLVPVVGGLVNIILSLYGFGIIVNALFKNKKNEPEVEIITEKI